MPDADPRRPSALLLDPTGSDLRFLSRVLSPEFDIRPARSPAEADAAARETGFAVAFVMAEDDLAAAREALAAVARMRPRAARVAVAAPACDQEVFGLTAAGAEHVVDRLLLETALRLAARAARETFALRAALEDAEEGLARLAGDAAIGAVAAAARGLDR